MNDLWPPQTDALTALAAALRDGARRVLVSMGTGCGKAVIVANQLDWLKKRRMLVLVHGTQLVNQMADRCAEWNPNRQVEIEQAEKWADHNADIIVASVDSVGRTGAKRIAMLRSFDLVSCDEADLSVSPTWLRALRQAEHADTVMTGWTATPFRHTGKARLEDLYDVLLPADDRWSLGWGVEHGYLCPVRALRVRTDVDIADVPMAGGDFEPVALARRINVDRRNSLIASALAEYAADRHTILIHCADKAHVETLCGALRQQGERAEYVHEGVPLKERTAIFARFHAGETRILCHCSVCLRGYDEPRIDCVVFARPSKSPVYWNQALGRGTRRDSAKKDCAVLELIDLCGHHRVQTTAQAFGMRAVDLLGQDPVAAKAVCERARELGVPAQDGETVAEVEARVAAAERVARGVVRVATVAEALDLFRAVRHEVQVSAPSQFPWLALSPDQFVLRLDSETKAHLTRKPEGWSVDVVNGVPLGGETIKQKAPVSQGLAVNSPTSEHGDLHSYEWSVRNGDSIPWRAVDQAVKRWAGYKRLPNGHHVPRWRLARLTAPWRGKPANAGQRRELKYRGMAEVPAEIKAGEAADLLTAIQCRSAK